jgi:hypothetical protein
MSLAVARGDRSASLAALGGILSESGIRFSDVLRSSACLVLFGSRVCGEVHASSDWDVLLIQGDRRRRRIRNARLDLQWIPQREVERRGFWQGELASHAAAHGLPLNGATLPVGCESLARAAAAKADRIRSRVEELALAWPHMSLVRSDPHVHRIKLDLQRFAMLSENTPVPATSTVATLWNNQPPERREELLFDVVSARASLLPCGLHDALSGAAASNRNHRQQRGFAVRHP